MIQLAYNGTNQMVREFKFPGGEVGVQIMNCAPEPENAVAPVELYATMRNSDEVMALLLTVDAVRRQYFGCKIRAYLPYIPYARQDRVCNVGEPLSAHLMASLLNACNFEVIMTSDPHSAVLPALLSNVVIDPQEEIFCKLRSDWSNIWIVAPDAGAAKKASDFAKRVGAAGVVQCLKRRNLSTGEITSLACADDVTGKHLFVLDDICDGGRTFVEVSNLLRPKAARIELAVTHGIFSKGVEVVAEAYDTVYTTNSYSGKIIKGKNVICLDILKV